MRNKVAIAKKQQIFPEKLSFALKSIKIEKSIKSFSQKRKSSASDIKFLGEQGFVREHKNIEIEFF